MKMRAILAGFAMLITVLSAFAVATPVAAAAAEEDVLYVAMQADMTDFNNYNLGTNSVWKAHVIQYCYEGLVTTDYDLSTVPWLATGWDFDEATLTVDVDLREGVLFHDGTEMTADDVVYSYLMVREGTTYSDRIVQAFDQDADGVVSLTEFDEGVQKTGDYSVRFVMAEPYGQFFSSTLSVPIVPKAIWDDPLNGFTDSEDKVIVTVSDELMTIGTGAWQYDSGVANSHRIIKTFDDYWGKDYVSPAGMPAFPVVLDSVYYKIYTSIDTAILALQGGDVDYIAWAVTAGRVPSLQSDPNIQLEYMSDSGYFYLAFNMKKEPMNNLTFRKAVSHLIDKDQIVDVYMGGFGQAGSAAVPPFFGEWHNPAVTKYAFDVDVANDLLDDAGYIDSNGDGWRDMPDGSLMDPITLLTPPADYDPIRIKAGQMLATNMRGAGINVEAKPIDFNTLVAKLTAFDYQMLELGWSFTGYTECVSLLFDIYGPMASSNSWAFWSPTYEHPDYADIGGVSTLADEATIAYVDEFALLEEEARGSFITSEQIAYVKEGQAIIADAIPCNILYYRVNVEAHNKVWANWTVFDGTLMNGFCLTTLDYAGAGGTSGGEAVTEISAGLTLPGKVLSGDAVEATVVVIDSLGSLVEGAAVVVNVTGGGVVASPAEGVTGADGVFTFDVTGTEIGESTVRVDVTLETSTDSDSASIRTYTKGGLGVVVTPEKISLVAGETIDVTCYVADADGPVEGAEVMIDQYLLGYGTITPEIAVTDADGIAVMEYTAPEADYLNQHMIVAIAASVTMDGYLYTNVGQAGIVVYNDDTPDWMLVNIDSVTTTALSPTSPSATITALLTDDSGTPIAGETLNVLYSDETLVSAPVTEVITDANGLADIDVTMLDDGASCALRVTVDIETAPNAIADTVTFTYVDPADLPTEPMYGGYMQYDVKFAEEWGTMGLTVYVNDQDGNPADCNATVIVPATSYGQLLEFNEYEMNSLWEYAGILIETEMDDQNLATAGAFASPLIDRAAEYMDFWWGFIPAGVTITGGVYTTDIYGVDLASLDLINHVYVLPGSYGTGIFDGEEDIGTRDDWGPWILNFVFHGQTLISSECGYGRGMGFTGVRYEIADPVLETRVSDFDTTTIDIWAYDENNDPIEGADAKVYQAATANTDYGVIPSTGKATDLQPTDVSGHASYEIVCAAWNAVTLAYDLPAIATVPNMYVRAYVDGTISLLSETKLVFEPIVRVAFAQLDAAVVPQPLGFAVMVSGSVTDLNGDAIADLPISVAVSGGVAYDAELPTDENGEFVVFVDPTEVLDASAAFVGVEISTGGLYESSSAKAMLAVFNTAPEVSVSAPEASGEVVGPNATVLGSVYDMNGLAAATLTVDSGTPIDLLDADGATVVLISEVLAGLAEGEHTVVVSATDSLGQESEVSVTFTLVAEEDAESSMLAWIVAIALLVVVVILAVLLLMKMKKPAGATPEGIEETEGPAPEEKKE